MRPLVTPEEMAKADQATIDRGTPQTMLMERAGRAVARAVVRLAGSRYGLSVAVVCGRGNNGGDGLVAARALVRAGCGVSCLLVEDGAGFKGAAKEHLDKLVATGCPLRRFDEDALRGADVIVDAVFGTGFRGPVSGGAAEAIAAIGRARAPVVAVDIPSGVEGASGRIHDPCVDATITVAFQAEKLGTALTPGATKAGRVEVVDIGIGPLEAAAWMTEPSDVARLWPRRPLDAHKRSAGALCLLGGSRGMSGALILAAQGALRSGAGYVVAAASNEVERQVSQALREVVTRAVADGENVGMEGLKRLGDVLERADAVAIGPGLGRGPDQAGLVEATLDVVDLPVVVDADGLNVLAGRTSALTERVAPTVITPHPAELARLLGTEVSEVQGDRVTAVRRAAESFACTVVLKGYRTLVADESGSVFVNPSGGPELATAGTGDVLTDRKSVV